MADSPEIRIHSFATRGAFAPVDEARSRRNRPERDRSVFGAPGGSRAPGNLELPCFAKTARSESAPTHHRV